MVIGFQSHSYTTGKESYITRWSPNPHKIWCWCLVHYLCLCVELSFDPFRYLYHSLHLCVIYIALAASNIPIEFISFCWNALCAMCFKTLQPKNVADLFCLSLVFCLVTLLCSGHIYFCSNCCIRQFCLEVSLVWMHVSLASLLKFQHNWPNWSSTSFLEQYLWIFLLKNKP